MSLRFVEPVMGLDRVRRLGRRRDQLGDLTRDPQVLARDDVRVAFGRELPVEPFRGDTGELEILPPGRSASEKGSATGDESAVIVVIVVIVV